MAAVRDGMAICASCTFSPAVFSASFETDCVCSCEFASVAAIFSDVKAGWEEAIFLSDSGWVPDGDSGDVEAAEGTTGTCVVEFCTDDGEVVAVVAEGAAGTYAVESFADAGISSLAVALPFSVVALMGGCCVEVGPSASGIVSASSWLIGALNSSSATGGASRISGSRLAIETASVSSDSFLRMSSSATISISAGSSVSVVFATG